MVPQKKALEHRHLGALGGDAPFLHLDDPEALELFRQVDEPAWIVEKDGRTGLAAVDGRIPVSGGGPIQVVGHLPSCPVESLGDPGFRKDHGLRYAYYTGAMANAIASVDLVAAMGACGFLSFFGSAGLPVPRVEQAIHELRDRIGDRPFGMNLIFNIHEPKLEHDFVDLYIREGVRLIEAAAYMELTLPLVKYRVHGIHLDSDGRIVAPNSIVAKVSRIEVASRFLSPPPSTYLDQLAGSGFITREQARLASRIPMAHDITGEADSGGHTDNRPAMTLLPTFIALRDRKCEEHRYEQKPRIGLAGGISTPQSAAAAFAMGASYIVTGSVNQSCVESGTSETVRQMLAETRQADVIMAPAADMFEMGGSVQVLKRGTMFGMRAGKLYDLYRAYSSIDEIPGDQREKVEKTIFRAPLESVWQETRAFFMDRDPSQVERAERDEKHKMALIFRSYLGQASGWASRGDEARKIDYQIWCGPAMDAFNEWVRGSFLEEVKNRDAATVALNILHGAACLFRLQSLVHAGIAAPPEYHDRSPVPLDKLTGR